MGRISSLIKNKHKRPTRLRRQDQVNNWNPSNFKNQVARKELTGLTKKVVAYAGEKPIALLEYILSQEKGQQSAAEQILRYLYQPDYKEVPAWARNKATTGKAKAALKLWGEKWPRREDERTLKECIYFITTAPGFLGGVENVPKAVERMAQIFQPGFTDVSNSDDESDDSDKDDNDQPQRITPTEIKDRRRRLMEMLRELREDAEDPEHLPPEPEPYEITYYLDLSGYRQLQNWEPLRAIRLMEQDGFVAVHKARVRLRPRTPRREDLPGSMLGIES